MIPTQPCRQQGVLILAMSAGDVADKNHKFMMTYYNVEKGHGQDSRKEGRFLNIHCHFLTKILLVLKRIGSMKRFFRYLPID